jgi:hypothetical protein
MEIQVHFCSGLFDIEAYVSCRVTAAELLDMAEALKIPETIIIPSCFMFDGIEALGFTLTHF